MEIDEKEGNKNYRSVPFRSVPTRCVIENSKKNGSKKIQKLKQYHYCLISSQNKLEEAEKERKKIYCSVSFLPDVY